VTYSFRLWFRFFGTGSTCWATYCSAPGSIWYRLPASLLLSALIFQSIEFGHGSSLYRANLALADMGVLYFFMLCGLGAGGFRVCAGFGACGPVFWLGRLTSSSAISLALFTRSSILDGANNTRFGVANTACLIRGVFSSKFYYHAMLWCSFVILCSC